MILENTESHLVEVPPHNTCDVCGISANLYHTRWFIHLCSITCLYDFERLYKEEIDTIAVRKLKGEPLT